MTWKFFRNAVPANRYHMRDFFRSWTTKDYVTAAIAVYGALLSTYSAWTKWRETRARVRVTLQLTIVTTPPMFNEDGTAIRISGQNHGFTDVHFGSFAASIRVKRLNQSLVVPNAGGLPATLKHGECVTVLGNLNALAEAIQQLKGKGTHKVRGVLRDDLNREHKSAWHSIDVS
jgi:hypothetical protein